MNRPAFQHRHAPVLIAGWCALLLYAWVSSPFGLAVGALIGSFDCTHQVKLYAGSQGTQLVLHHDGKWITHRHNPLARALVAFAQPASATNPDHVIQFSTPDSLSQLAQLSVPAPEIFAQPDLALLETFLPSPRETFCCSLPTDPPPDHCEQLLCLSSTLLRI